MRTDNDQVIYLKDYASSPYLIPEVTLRFDIGAAQTRVVAQLTVVPADGTAPDTPLVLDGDTLGLDSIAIDGAPLTEDQFAADETTLTIVTPPHQQFVLETEVTIFPDKNSELMGLYRSSGVWCTQCEPEGFRRITWFLDRPDILSRYTVHVNAPKELAPVLLANGNCVETGDLPEGRYFAVWEDPHPKPSYLFALVAGDLGSITDSFTTASGREVALAIYCEHGKEDQCTYAMDSLKRSMAWDEKRFGREYDLDVFNVVAVSDFNFGAMENKGLNIFNDRLVLASPDIATDANYERIESVIAHEYFHNWTGNRITCRDWFQLCLKEGLTVYRDQEFTSDERSRAVKRIEDVRGLRMAQFPEDGGPLAHPARPDHYSEINNFYTSTVYDKGAEIVRMLATLLGDDGFRKGTDLYFERHDGEATTIEAWLKVFEDSSGRDLSQFGKWYTQAGTPEISAEGEWNAEKKTYRLILTQKTRPTPGQPNKDALLVPIKFGLVGPNGNDMTWSRVTGGTVEDDLIVLDRPRMELVFEGLANKPTPSLFRGFSAPVRISSDATEDDKLFLARHDSDPFNRWQALQDAAMALMTAAVRNNGNFADPEAVTRFAEALGETLESDQLDSAFKAHALAIPGESNIAQTLGRNINPALIHTVRRTLLKTVSQHLYDKLKSAYTRLGEVCSPYSIDAEPTRARALRNQCLSLLVASGTQDAESLAVSQYETTDNMTDRSAALGVLVANASAHAQKLLDEFHARYADNMLVYDKWLSLSASAPDDGCLERVRAIFTDPAFPKTNPNRLRSLAGTFAMSNPVQFGRPDGAGFRFIVEFCREVDPINPQVSARVLTAFRSWADYEPERRKAAKAALDILASTDSLSRNVTEILTRTLEASDK